MNRVTGRDEEGYPSIAPGYSADIVVTRLNAYEELEEQNRLVVFPCGLSARVYVVFNGDIEEGIVQEIRYHEVECMNGPEVLQQVFVVTEENARWYDFDDFGVKVFLNYEDAKIIAN